MKSKSNEYELAGRIALALEYAKDGTVDGAHHKMWVIDQMVRALTNCPLVEMTGIDCNGKPYKYTTLGESSTYRHFVADIAIGLGEWDKGIAS